MVKADLTKVVYEAHGGISQREAKEIVELILRLIKTRLAQGESVKLSGFGSLNVVERRSRPGRNPQTGEQLELPSSRHITFRPSRILKF